MAGKRLVVPAVLALAGTVLALTAPAAADPARLPSAATTGLRVTKTFAPRTVRPGSRTTATIRIENTGTVPAVDIRVRDVNPHGLTPHGSQAGRDATTGTPLGACGTAEQVVLCRAASLEPGQIWEITVPLLAGSDATGSEIDTVGVTADNTDPVAATARLRIRGTSAGAATCAGISPATGQAGDHVTIRGSGLGTGAAVTFNGLFAAIASATRTSIDAVVPPGATTGHIVASGANCGTFTAIESSPTMPTQLRVTKMFDFASVPDRSVVHATILVENIGQADAVDVRIRDQNPYGLMPHGSPAGVDVMGHRALGTCGTAGQVVLCREGTLAPGQAWKVIVPLAAAGPGDDVDTVSVTSDTTTPVSTTATLHVRGPGAPLPTTCAAIAPGTGQAGDHVTIRGRLPAGAGAVLFGDLFAAAAFRIPGRLDVTVPAGATSGPVLANGARCGTYTTVGSGDSGPTELRVTKMFDFASVPVGTLVHATILVENTGQADAVDLVVVDRHPPGLRGHGSASAKDVLTGRGHGTCSTTTRAATCGPVTLAAGDAIKLTVPLVATRPGDETNMVSAVSDDSQPVATTATLHVRGRRPDPVTTCTGLTPTTGHPGDHLTLVGGSFGGTGARVLVNGRFATVGSATATSLGVTVPDGTSTGPVVVNGARCGTFTTDAVCTPDTTTFSIAPGPVAGAYDPGQVLAFTVDGVPACTYDWRFGDGGVASGSHVRHAYGAPGTFPVTLTARSSQLGTGHEVAGSVVVEARCATGPIVSTGSFTGVYGTYDVMITGACGAVIAAGATSLMARLGAGTMLTAWEAHAPAACTFPAAGVFGCPLKPSGRVCMLMATSPMLNAGTTVGLDFVDRTGMVVATRDVTTAASSAPACPIGDNPP
jgi:uncharacterized repeat protein (TIGR01451 family)